MDSKRQMWKSDWLKGKDKWLFLLVIGVILLILAIPTEDSKKKQEEEPFPIAEDAGTTSTEASANASQTYEQQMEARVKEILSHVEGVGKVDVMIVLKSSEEKVLRVDTSSTSSSTQETDSSGGSRKIENRELAENTILSGSGENAPIIEKELKPVISGVVISAGGGGSPKVKAEISEAMEALFDVPPHKVKVLKRVE